jgi:hypothetical protein
MGPFPSDLHGDNGTVSSQRDLRRTQMNFCKKSFDQPAKLVYRVISPGDGFAEPGDRKPKCFGAHEVGRQMRFKVAQIDLNELPPPVG